MSFGSVLEGVAGSSLSGPGIRRVVAVACAVAGAAGCVPVGVSVAGDDVRCAVRDRTVAPELRSPTIAVAEVPVKKRVEAAEEAFVLTHVGLGRPSIRPAVADQALICWVDPPRRGTHADVRRRRRLPAREELERAVLVERVADSERRALQRTLEL